MKRLSKSRVRVPGKLMILGEHAVIYGNECIVTAVDRYLTVSIIQTDLSQDEIISPGEGDHRFIKKAIAFVRDRYLLRTHFKITVDSELGHFGLGSSAAVTAAAIYAVTALFDIRLTRRALFNLAFEVVKNIQGRASGFDLAACIYGGTICFNGKTKKITPVAGKLLPIVVGYSGKKGSTVAMIDKVVQLRSKQPAAVRKIFSRISHLANEGKNAIEKGDWKILGKLFTENHLLLQKLGVSTEKLDNMVTASREAGAYGAKLSGAGGGDCMIAIVSKDKRLKVVEAIRRTGGEVLDLKTGVVGIQEVN